LRAVGSVELVKDCAKIFLHRSRVAYPIRFDPL
jgi:hypothetical protein